jgi:fucose permease
MNSTETSHPKQNLQWLGYLSFVALGLPIGLLGVAWPTLRAGFEQPLDAMGFVLISYSIGYLVSSFITARLINRFGIGSLLVASGLLSAVALAGYTLAPTWAVFVVIGAAFGFGAGLMDAGLNTYFAAVYNESQMQWLHASFGIGATLSPLFMTTSLALFSAWRPAYIFVSLVMAGMTVVYILNRSAWVRPSRGPEIAQDAAGAGPGLMDYKTSLWDTLFRLATWMSILIFLLYTGGELILGNWTYTIFTESRGVSPALAGIWAGGYWATFTLGRVLAGFYAHRVKLNTLMFGAMAVSITGAVLFWWNPTDLVGVLGVFVVGLGTAPVFPGLVSSTGERVGQRHSANTIGFQIAAANLGGALLPSLAGALAQRNGLESISVLLVISQVAMLAFYWVSVRASRAWVKDQPRTSPARH